MATIASLNVNLGMNTAAFDAKSKKIKGQVTDLASSNGLGKLFAGGAAFGAGMAAFNAITAGAERAASAISSMVYEQIQAIDATADLADAVGTSVEQFSRLQHAARYSDVEIAELEIGLKKLGPALGKAIAGGKDPFEKLGLSAEKLAGKDRIEAILDLADAISKLPNQAAQAAAAQAAGMGKMLPLLQKSRAELEALFRESDSSGRTISALDAGKIAAADEALKHVEDKFNSIARVVTMEVAPAIAVAAEAFESMNAKSSGTILEDLLNLHSTFMPYETNGEAVADLLAAKRKEIELEIQRQSVLKKLEGNKPQLDTESLEAGQKIIDQLQEQVDLYGKIGHAREIAQAKDDITDKNQLAQIEALGKQLDALDKQKKLQDEIADAAERRQAIIEGAMTAEERHAAEIAKIRKEADFVLLWDGWTAEVDKLEGVIDKMEAAEASRKKMELASNPLARVGEESKTPMEEMEARMKELDDALFGGFIDEDHFALERLKAAKDFAAVDRVAQDTGPQRPGALEQGTAAAFSASFGAQAKPLDKIAKIEADMLVVMRRIDEKLPVVVAGKL